MMRKKGPGGRAAIIWVMLAIVAVTLIGCGGRGSGDPGAVAQEFLNTLIAHDPTGSFALLSEKFKGEWGITAVDWNGVMMRDPIPETASYSVKSQDIQGDTAVVTITPAGGAEEQVRLVRENGKWLIDYELGQWYGLD